MPALLPLFAALCFGAQDDARGELLARAAAFSEATSYHAIYTAQQRRNPGDEESRRERGERVASDAEQRAPVRNGFAFAIGFEAGKPDYFVSSTTGFFRTETRFALPHPLRGKWFVIDRVRGDMSKARRGEGETARMFDQAHGIVLPHLALRGLDAQIGAVERVVQEGGVVYRATLNEAGARAWGSELVWGAPPSLPAAPARPPPARRGAGSLALDASAPGVAGRLELTVAGDAITRVVATVQTLAGAGRIALEVERTFELDSIGTWRTEIPPEAAAVLD